MREAIINKYNSYKGTAEDNAKNDEWLGAAFFFLWHYVAILWCFQLCEVIWNIK